MDFIPPFHTFTRCVVEKELLRSHPFTLVDVGCSGGIPKIWRHFQHSLRVIGVDPQVAECRRLQAEEEHPGISFVPRFLGLPDDHPFREARGDREPWTGNPWERTSAARAIHILRAQADAPSAEAGTVTPADDVATTDATRQLNAWDGQELVEEATTSTLDEMVRELKLGAVDFIKIDVDGPDLEVLLSAEETLRNSPALGLAIEVNYSGSADPTDNTFHNIDRAMRGWGFDLFDLTARKCSMAGLPDQFRYDDAPHETTFGRVLQGDALYLRDPLGWRQNPAARVELSAHQILKLCCLYELFGTPDHIAELLSQQPELISEITDPQDLLHLLAHQFDPRFENYDDYIRSFREDPTSLYPSRRPPTPRS